jgi:hypothetical protein
MESSPLNFIEGCKETVEKSAQDTEENSLSWKEGLEFFINKLGEIFSILENWKIREKEFAHVLDYIKKTGPKYLKTIQDCEKYHKRKVEKLKKSIRLKKKEIKFLKSQANLKSV